jgi:hypothetical protein
MYTKIQKVLFFFAKNAHKKSSLRNTQTTQKKMPKKHKNIQKFTQKMQKTHKKCQK